MAASRTPGPQGPARRAGVAAAVSTPLADEVGVRPMRADAARNRLRILQAAEEVFARQGIAVPVDVVAEHAGVGVGTVYRHFPTKEALFEAIVVTRIDDLLRTAEDAQRGEPTEAFFAFLRRMAEQIALKHDLFDAMAAAGVDFKSRCAEQMDELRSLADDLRCRAVEDGGVRSDVTIDEVMGLVIGACLGAERPGMGAQCGDRMLQVVIDGLRARA